MDSLSKHSKSSEEAQTDQEIEQSSETEYGICCSCSVQLQEDKELSLNIQDSDLYRDLHNGYLLGRQKDGYITVLCKNCWTKEVLQLEFVQEIISKQKIKIKHLKDKLNLKEEELTQNSFRFDEI